MNAVIAVESAMQQEFDQKYITSSEICDLLGVGRVHVHSRRKRGLLPNPIYVRMSVITLWDRKEIEPYLHQWRAQLNEKLTARSVMQ